MVATVRAWRRSELGEHVLVLMSFVRCSKTTCRRRRPVINALTKTETAALVCYLAVSELATFGLQGEWLSTANLVESASIWLARNDLATSWLDRVSIARMTHKISKGVAGAENLVSAPIQAERLFIDAMLVNFADPLVAKVWRTCLELQANRAFRTCQIADWESPALRCEFCGKVSLPGRGSRGQLQPEQPDLTRRLSVRHPILPQPDGVA